MKLRQSTAANIMMGPFLDATDGDTEEVLLTITQSDVRVSKNGSAWTQKNDATNSPHSEAGFYRVNLDATDTGNTGNLKLAIHMTGALYVWVDCEVLEPSTYDALYTQGLNNFNPTTDTVASVTTVATTTTNTDMRGTDGANTTAPDNAGIAANGVAIAALNDFNPTTDTVANVTLVATTTTNTDMRGTDGANTVAPDNAGIAANGVAIAALNNISTAQVNAEVLDVLNVDTFPELTGVPTATSSLVDKITWSFMLSRNKMEQTATTTSLRNDADSLTVSSSSTTDDGTTFTRNEFG